MAPQLREALTKRKRVWGQQNAAVLHAIRLGKLEFRRWPFRLLQALGSGGYVTRIPGAP